MLSWFCQWCCVICFFNGACMICLPFLHQFTKHFFCNLEFGFVFNLSQMLCGLFYFLMVFAWISIWMFCVFLIVLMCVDLFMWYLCVWYLCEINFNLYVFSFQCVFLGWLGWSQFQLFYLFLVSVILCWVCLCLFSFLMVCVEFAKIHFCQDSFQCLTCSRFIFLSEFAGLTL